MNKKSLSREEAEKKEGLEEVKQDVPENRLQQNQQVQDTDDAQSTKPQDSSFSKKKSEAKGTTLKQEVISEAITGSSAASGMGINAAGRGVSGTMGGVLGANNSTPFADKSRSDTRVGKKLDRIANKLNFTPSEQVLVGFDESKPLADAATEDQGYNGTYRNETARSQKILGAVPADLMFQRSVDFIMKDKLYFVEGQMIFQTGDNNTSYDPSYRVNPLTGEYESVTYHSGNFLHQGVHYGIDTNGQVKYVYFDVLDITPNAMTAEGANAASAHRLIKSNVAELDRISMDAKAGDEKADIWTPLARAISEPTKASWLMSSIEADTGAYAYLAYSKASTNMAFQLNRGPKDGLSIIIPAIEQCVGWRITDDNSVAVGTAYSNSLQTCFDEAYYRLGDPSLMIEAYDSTKKFNNKADLLLQPRGWRMHLQTADNNINPLHCPAEFVNVYNGTEVFSTIDHEYDPLMPICMTDKANLITVHNLNELSAFYDLKLEGQIDISATNIEASYTYDEVLLYYKDAIKNLGYPSAAKIYIHYKKTAGDGLVWSDSDSSKGIISFDPDSTDTDRTINVIISFTESTISGYTKIATLDYNYAKDIVIRIPKVQNASGTVVTAVNYVFEEKHVEYYGAGEYAYKYSDLRNEYIVEVKHPLVHGIMEWLNQSIGGKIRSCIKQTDFYIPLVFSTQYMTLAQLVICASMPWISKVRLNSMKDVIYYEDNIHEYPYSKLRAIKDLPFKNYVNFGYTDYDHALETKVMNPVQAITWTMPEFIWKVAADTYVLPWYFNENDLNSDGTINEDEANMSMPSIRSGVRLAGLDNLYGMSEKDIRLSLDRMTKYLLDDSDITNFYAYKYGRTTDGQPLVVMDSGKHFTIGKLLKAPRELGLSMDAPLGVLTRDKADTTQVGGKDVTTLKALTADGIATSYRIKVFTNVNTLLNPDILSAAGVNINRAANYSQKWVELQANGATTDVEIIGLCFGMGDDVAAYQPVAALSTGAAVSDVATITSYQRSLNTRIQYLPFVISPFDGVYNSLNNPVDIYDLGYYFGLCGFRASDYRESIYNREKEVINQGLTFVEDPWVLASPIIKNGSTSTGVKIGKGYELK